MQEIVKDMEEAMQAPGTVEEKQVSISVACIWTNEDF